MCSAHDYVEKKWRHLNFFQHHCYLTTKVPRVKWLYILLFEQVILLLVREMPVMAISRLTSVTDKRLWRIILHYVDKGVAGFDLSEVKGVALDETASKRSHNYVTTFIDMDKPEHPVIYATKGRSSETLASFKEFMTEHKGSPEKVKRLSQICRQPFCLGSVNTFLLPR